MMHPSRTSQIQPVERQEKLKIKIQTFKLGRSWSVCPLQLYRRILRRRMSCVWTRSYFTVSSGGVGSHSQRTNQTPHGYTVVVDSLSLSPLMHRLHGRVVLRANIMSTASSRFLKAFLKAEGQTFSISQAESHEGEAHGTILPCTM